MMDWTIKAHGTSGRTSFSTPWFRLLLVPALFLMNGFGSLSSAADSARIIGKLTDPQGAMVADARVTVTESAEPLHETRTDAQGSFVFEGVRPGDCIVWPVPQGGKGSLGRSSPFVPDNP